MNVTPKDILEKEFNKKLNGYDPEQVDEFLDEIIKQFESLLEENEEILVKNEALKSEVSKLKQQTDKIGDIEDKLMAAVSTAQKNAALYVEKAEMQARRITEIANQNAKTVIESTHLRMEAAAQEIRKYEKVIRDFKLKFKMFLDEQAGYLDMHLTNDEELSRSASEVTRSLNNLSRQIRELDKDSEETSYHLNDILQESREDYSRTDYDLAQSTADLHTIVSEIIDE